MENDLSLEQLADATRISHSALGAYENDETSIKKGRNRVEMHFPPDVYDNDYLQFFHVAHYSFLSNIAQNFNHIHFLTVNVR